MKPATRRSLFALLPLLCAALPLSAGDVKVSNGRPGGRQTNPMVPGGGASYQAPNGQLTNVPTGSNVLGTIPVGAPTVTPQNALVDQAPVAGGGMMNVAPLQRNAPAPMVFPVTRQNKVAASKTAPDAAPQGETLSDGLRMMGAGGSSAPSEKAPDSGSSHLDSAVSQIGMGQAAEAKGGDMAVGKALEVIFDASHRTGGAGGGPAGSVPGSVSSSEEKVQQLVAVANTSNPRDAARLYSEAIETAEKAFSPAVASQVRQAVLASAEGKAQESLPILANSAYLSAAAGLEKEVEKDLKGLDRWEKLLGAPGRPLVENGRRLKQDISRVLMESRKAAAKTAAGAAGKTVSAPRIFFRRSGDGVYSAVLPSGSVAALPKDFIAATALSEGSEAAFEDAWASFQRDPSAVHGAGLIYRAQREAGASALRGAGAAASYWVKAAVGGLWQRLRAFVLSLFGRGLSVDARRGLTVEAPASLASLKGAPASWGPSGLTVARSAQAHASLKSALALFASIEADRAFVLAGLEGRSESSDLKALLSKSRSLASAHAALTFDGSAAAAVEAIAKRTERRGELTSADAEALAHWARRMGATALSATLSRTGTLPANVLLKRDGRALALVDAGTSEGAGLRAAGLLLQDGPVQGSFVVMGERLWGGWAKGGSFAKVYADLRSTEQGGQIKVLWRSGDVEAEAEALSALGFSVERRGSELSATLDAETAAAGAQSLAEALTGAVALLQGRPAEAGPQLVEEDLAVLMADVKAQPGDSRKVALALQASDPVPFNYVTIGRVGPFTAQGSRRRLKDGRRVVLTLLRDTETGSAAFGRVALEGAALGPEKVASLLLAQ